MPPVSTDSKYAPTSWGAEVLGDLVVPSGQTCQVRRPGMQGLIAEGILDRMDILTAMVNDQHIERVKKGRRPDRVNEITSDPAKILEVLNSVDRVVAYIVTQPTVRRPVVTDDEGVERRIEDDDREPGVIYTDLIDVEDKMFLFNYAVGGTRDVARFREQSDAVVGGVDSLEAVEGPAK